MIMSKKIIPILPLRDIVVFPGMVAPLFVGRKQSVNALNNTMSLGIKKQLSSQMNGIKQHLILSMILIRWSRLSL